MCPFWCREKRGVADRDQTGFGDGVNTLPQKGGVSSPGQKLTPNLKKRNLRAFTEIRAKGDGTGPPLRSHQSCAKRMCWSPLSTPFPLSPGEGKGRLADRGAPGRTVHADDEEGLGPSPRAEPLEANVLCLVSSGFTCYYKEYKKMGCVTKNNKYEENDKKRLNMRETAAGNP